MKLFCQALSALWVGAGTGLGFLYRYFYVEPCSEVAVIKWEQACAFGHYRRLKGMPTSRLVMMFEIRAHMGVYTGRILDDPTFIIGNRVRIGEVGEKVYFTVNRNITLEDDVVIGPTVQTSIPTHTPAIRFCGPTSCLLTRAGLKRRRSARALSLAHQLG